MRLLAVVLLVCALAAAATPAWPSPDRSHLLAQAEGVEPLGKILRRIEERYPGRALDAELIEREQSPIYRVKWLGEDGKVREITADARTGRILEVR